MLGSNSAATWSTGLQAVRPRGDSCIAVRQVAHQRPPCYHRVACLWLQVVAVGRHSGEAAAYLGVSVDAVLFEQVGDQSRLIRVDEACEQDEEQLQWQVVGDVAELSAVKWPG